MKPVRDFLMLLLLASAPLTSGAQDSTPINPAAVDTTPNDPAAVGFLVGVVDEYLYSPEADGLDVVEARAKVRWFGAQPAETPQFDVDFEFQLAKGQMQIHWPKHLEGKFAVPLQEPVLSLLHLSMRPSRELLNFVGQLEHEEQNIRIDFRPRSADFQKRSGWYTEDGLPLKSRDDRKNLLMPDATPVTAWDVEYEYKVIDGRRVRVRRKDSSRFGESETRYEYETRDGFLMLKKLTMAYGGLGLEISYDINKLTRAAKASGNGGD